MPTSVTDRFNKLFANQAKPTPPDPSKIHIADAELKVQEEMQQRQWQIPDVAQYPRETGKLAKLGQKAQNIEQMTSSDDDDEYVAMFKTKPQMNIPKISKKASSKPVIESADLPTRNENGDLSTGHFCVLQLVAKFPYRYMADVNGRVSKHFFANNKFYDREWEIYYVDPPESLFSKPLLLLPYAQVKALIDEIGQTLDIEVVVPSEPFTLSFFQDGTPQPEFLGTSTCREDVADMQASIPPAPSGHGEAPENCSRVLERSFAAFRAKCETAQLANKKKSAAVKRKKAHDRFTQIQDWVKQFKRAQRYLGLRPRAIKPTAPDWDMSWEEQEEFRIAQEKKCHVVLDPLDVNAKAPFPFDHETVIVSVDIEAYERAHHLITEIGISTLDTLDLVDLEPGDGGENWTKHIRSRHFRIKEREFLRNKDFCYGNPEDFQFGQSEFVSLKNAPEIVDSCFEYPFSAGFQHDGTLKHADCGPGEPVSPVSDTVLTIASIDANGPTRADHAIANAAVAEKLGSPTTSPTLNPAPIGAPQKGSKQRNLLLLGHDIRGDIAYLQQLGSGIFSSPKNTYPVQAMDLVATGASKAATQASILEALDTAILYRVLKKESQTRSLASVLTDVGRYGWSLHNAGNDARYTLEAFIAMVIKSRLEDDEAEAKHQEDLAAVDGSKNAVTNPNVQTEKEETTSERELEKQHRLAEKPEAVRKEVEEEWEAWEAARSTGTTRLRSSPSPDTAELDLNPMGSSSGVNSRGVFATSLPLLPKSPRTGDGGDPAQTFVSTAGNKEGEEFGQGQVAQD